MSVQAITPSQTVGPFFGFALPYAGGPVVAEGGDLRVYGSVYDGADALVPDAVVEVLQADGAGAFAAAEVGGSRGFRGFGRCSTRPDGRYAFTTVKPGSIGDDHAPHLALIVHARGLLLHLHTRMYFPEDAEANAADPVMGAVPEHRRHTLIGERTEEGVRFDIRLQGRGETVFFDV